jgi:hypothetical protein
MTGKRYRKHLASPVGALTGLLAVVLLIVTLDGPGEFVPGAGSLFGWGVPLVALFVIAAVTWLLLARDGDDDAEGEDLYLTCDSCGHSVLREWRLCPYCGAQLREWSPGERTFGQG